MITNNNNILFFKDLLLSKIQIDNIFSELNYSVTGTKRICLHESDKSDLHVMLIEILKNTNYPPHLHKDSDEYFLFIDGNIEVVIWRDGIDKQPEKIYFDNIDSQNMIVRIPKNSVHMTIPMQNSRYFEIKLGPFLKDNMIVFNLNEIQY